jgi:hypothetical protein
MNNPLAQLHLVTIAERSSLQNDMEQLLDENWPRYTFEANLPKAFQSDDVSWLSVYKFWPCYQFGLYNDAGDLVACGNSLPLALDGGVASLPSQGWDWGINQGISDYRTGATTDTLMALAITVNPNYRKKGYGCAAIMAMEQIAVAQSLNCVVAPVRPSLKHLYPLIPISEYVKWQNSAGKPFDPWLRTHINIGGEVIRPCAESMTYTGKIAEWEEWLNMDFPVSSTYVVPEMLSTLVINREFGQGTYVEPNVWVMHLVGAKRA